MLALLVSVVFSLCVAFIAASPVVNTATLVVREVHLRPNETFIEVCVHYRWISANLTAMYGR